MRRERATGRGGIAVDADGLAAVERVAAYEIANTLVTVNLRLQNALSMRPEELQVFLVIVLATVQRYLRSADPDPVFLTRTPLPADLAGFISRRRISDVLDIPLETVRRHVGKLVARGLVVERGRGRLSTSGGTLELLAEGNVPADVATDIAALSNALVRQGAFRVGARDRS